MLVKHAKDEKKLVELYPKEKWSPEFHAEVKRRRRWNQITFLWSIPFSWLTSLFERRKVPVWNSDHYKGWSPDELIWRICFLQGAGRHAWAEGEAWRLVVTPLAAVIAFAAGLWLGK